VPLRHHAIIETDTQAFKTDVENAGHGKVIVLDPGQTHQL
jgi:hypothetical protein